MDKRLGAFLKMDPEAALAQAREADAKRSRGEALGRLHGVPVAVKDMIVTRGIETTCGSKILAGFIPPYDAHVVERIKEEGGVVLGKTNLDEFAFGSSNENSGYKRCGNPWSRHHVPGGSSGGSAAAVSAGFAPLALGTDTGGSVRQPASLCGVVGLKPTYGRVSRYGVVAFASSLDQCGPMAGDVRDTALLLSVIAGKDPRDATSADVLVPDYVATLGQRPGQDGRWSMDDGRRLRIGVPKEYFPSGAKGLEPDVASTITKALARLSELGADVEETSLPHSPYAIPAYYVLAVAEASSNLARYDSLRYGPKCPESARTDLEQCYMQARAAGFGDEVKRRIILGTFALSAGYYDAYYVKAMKVRTLIRRDFDAAFRKFDLLAAPTSPVAGFRLGELVDDPLTMYQMDVLTVPVNLADVPGISVPAGFSSAGLPIGLQLIAPRFEEARLLRAAYAFEQAGPPRAFPPGWDEVIR